MAAPAATLPTVLVSLLVLITLPASGSLLMVLNARDRRRLHVVADRTSCIRCGQLLGRAALDAADVGWAVHMAELRRRHPHTLLRVIRFLYARCTVCGMEYDWEVQSRSFNPLPCDRERELPVPDANLAGPQGR